MSKRVVDLDDLESWPNEIRAELDRNLDSLIAERRAERKYDLSADRWFKPAPPMPFTERACDLILKRMETERLRVFHATRLLDFDEVRRDGLRPLVLQERVSRLRDLAKRGRLNGISDGVDELIAGVDLSDKYFTIREMRVWATPRRRYLHDGGCDVFFEHWGGEAVQRLARMASPELEAAIKQIGAPAVVIANIPAIGVCEGSTSRMPPTMVELALQASGRINVSIGAWDVRTKQPFPPEWIENIVPPDHPSVTAS
jgi:hypothetical protein